MTADMIESLIASVDFGHYGENMSDMADVFHLD